ncbi:MAG: DUF3592 domain-containing protein [Lachnospiraceae bacterium]|nr:DUF3592 domain-containing protein [Lachnospiraceae bacterium]
MKILFIILLGLAAIFLITKLVQRKTEKLKCNSVTQGKLIGNDVQYTSSGGQPGSYIFYAIYYPIYEYEVNGEAYQIQLSKYSKNVSSFDENVDVYYNPEDPEICFIKDVKGKIVSKYDKDEYEKNSGGTNLTSDYKWRP